MHLPTNGSGRQSVRCPQNAGQFLLSYAGQIVLMELANPTEALETVKQTLSNRSGRRMQGIVRDLIGPEAAEEYVAFCVISIIHQCLGFDSDAAGCRPCSIRWTRKRSASLTEHIHTFSLAGIRAVRVQPPMHPDVRSDDMWHPMRRSVD